MKAIGRPGAEARPFIEARILGGGSSVMGMWALRGPPSDYDAWAAAGARGWAYDDVLPFFAKLERDLDFSGNAHGKDGPIPIRRVPRADWPGYVAALADAATRHGLPAQPDINGSADDGVFPLPFTTDGRGRVSTATGYLTADVRRRPNLTIVTGVEATGLTFDGKAVTGVNFRRGDGTDESVRAPHVVMTAGALHSPALLLRSGIGSAADLKSLGIDVVADLPEVGRNLQNHTFVHFGAVVRPHARQNPTIRNYGLVTARLSSGHPGAPPSDLLATFIGRIGGKASGNSVGMIIAALYAPFSRGQVTLTSAKGAPKFDFRLLSDPGDEARMVQVCRFAKSLLEDAEVRTTIQESFILPANPPMRLLNTPGLKSQIFSALFGGIMRMGSGVRRAAIDWAIGKGRYLSSIPDDAAFARMCLDSALPMYHPAGTCALGTVVEPTTRVIGVRGLYVADASIMPIVPRANTSIPTMMVAEKAAAHILSGLQ